MAEALFITGDTYTSRRQIKSLGGKWNPDESGWLIPMEREADARVLADEKAFACDIIDVDPILLETPTGERLRAIRQAQIDRRAERKLARADRLEKKAQEIDKSLESYNDWAFWTEPVKIGHHSEQRHRNLRNRLQNKMDKKFEALTEADKLRDEARPVKARIAGDAARRDQEIREQLDKVISVGSRVTDFCYGNGEVIRVNKKSNTICWDRSGNTFARDKIFVQVA